MNSLTLQENREVQDLIEDLLRDGQLERQSFVVIGPDHRETRVVPLDRWVRHAEGRVRAVRTALRYRSEALRLRAEAVRYRGLWREKRGTLATIAVTGGAVLAALLAAWLWGLWRTVR